jgi:hypothetical protein
MRLVSVSVGVVEYRESYYQGDTSRLQYAESDAMAFQHYCIAASDLKDNFHHVALLNKAATLADIEAAIAAIATIPSIDLFVLYLAGHGEKGEESGGWFCLHDAVPRAPSLDGNAIDRLLRSVSSEMTLLLIDCCHAEATTGDIPFFLDLQGKGNRAYLASARAHQLAWEDDALKRSIFSDVLLRALSTDGAPALSSGAVSFESSLVPYLRQQVPLLASRNKRGVVQEPVTGGAHAFDFAFPVVTSKSLGRPLTITQTVRARFRRWLTIMLVAVVAAFAMCELILYHVAVNSTGRIVVRPGLRETFGLLPVHVGREIDTGFSLDDLNPRKPEAYKDLDLGKWRGVSSHLDAERQRPWLSQIEPSFTPHVAERVAILARGDEATFDTDNTPPFEEAAFLALLSGTSVEKAREKIYSIQRPVPPACNSDAENNFDFNLLNIAQPVFLADLAWGFFTASKNEKQRGGQIEALVHTVAYRAIFHKETGDEAPAEAEALARELMKMRRQYGAWSVQSMATIQPSQSHSWCSIYDLLMRGLLGNESDAVVAERSWRKAFSTKIEKNGDLETKEQAIAWRALGYLAQIRPLEKETFESILNLINDDKRGLSSSLRAVKLLERVAGTQALPDDIRAMLFSHIGPRREEFDFDPVEAFVILASNYPFLKDVERQKLVQWVKDEGNGYRTFDSLREGLGYLAINGEAHPEYLAMLQNALSPASRFRPQATGYRGEMVVAATSDSAVVSLGRWAQRSPLPSETVAQIANIAASRPDLASRDEVLKGLAYQWDLVSADADAKILRLLSKYDDEAVQRQLVEEVSALALTLADPPQRKGCMERLMTAWKSETEPELRMSIARVLGRTVFLR